MSNISISQLLQLHNPIIIDIRNVQSYNNNHIPGSKNIPMEKLIVEPQKYLQKNTTYYLYCQKGFSSERVCQILRKMGYYCVNISGGYESWILGK